MIAANDVFKYLSLLAVPLICRSILDRYFKRKKDTLFTAERFYHFDFHFIVCLKRRKEGNVLFNDGLNIFYERNNGIHRPTYREREREREKNRERDKEINKE